MPLRSTEYGELVDRLWRRAAAARQPFNGAFELTCRCNLQCGMCYIRPQGAECAGGSSTGDRELSAREWSSLASEAAGNGLVFLLLTGGEPLLRTDFFEIYEPVRALGLNLTLFTNGTLVSKDVANRLAQSPPNRLEITLYGASAATYEAVTGVRGSHARCLSGIENLRSAGVPLTLKTTLNRHNIGELDAMQEMAREWGLVLGKSWFLTPRRDRHGSALEEYRLPPADVIGLEVADRKRRELDPRDPGPVEAGVNNVVLPCGAGTNSFLITARGEMNICMDLPRPAARPLECGFAAAWEAVQRAAESVPTTGPCGGCELEPYCSRCAGYAWLEEGDSGGAVPYLCEVARERRARLPLGDAH